MILAPVLAGAVILFSVGLIFFVKNKGSKSDTAAVADRSVVQETLREIEEETAAEAAEAAEAETENAVPEKTPDFISQTSETAAAAVMDTTEAPTASERKGPTKPAENSSVQKGWSSSPKGWKYYDENGNMLTNEWLEDGTDHWFYFGADGFMLHDTVTPDGFYVGSDGEMISNPPSAGQSSVGQSSAGQTAASNPFPYAFGTGTALPDASTGQQISGEFVFPNSSNVPLSSSDMNGKTEWECRVARNEIYARHGRRFKDASLQAHFDSCSWYKGTIAPEAFRDDSVLSKLEKDNIKVIEAYEKQHHYNNH